MGEFGGGNALRQARGAWLFDRIGETGSIVFSMVGGDHAGTTAAHRYLTLPQSSVAAIFPGSPVGLGTSATRLRA